MGMETPRPGQTIGEVRRAEITEEVMALVHDGTLDPDGAAALMLARVLEDGKWLADMNIDLDMPADKARETIAAQQPATEE